MKKLTTYLVTAIIAITSLTVFQSCKKGSDDPVLSLRTRKDRFTNTWTLNKMEKNGVNQDITGSTYVYNARSNGTLTETVEGSIFGLATKRIREGNWEFINQDEDAKISFTNDITTYNIQRLANTELWLKQLKDGDTYVYYFDGQ